MWIVEQLDILLPRHTLEEALGEELAKQAHLRWGEDCRYMPVTDGQSYLCSCGTVNPMQDPCSNCGRWPELLERSVLESLRQDMTVRLEEEAREAQRQEQLRQQEAKHQKRRKIRKRYFWVMGGLTMLALVAVAFWVVTRVAIPAGHYRKALSALQEGDYQQAHRQFTLAGDYRDAEVYLERFATPLLSSRVYMENKLTQTTYTYDEAGRQLESVVQIFAQDADGNWLATAQEDVQVQRYDENGNVLVYADWNGHRVYVYNEQGDVVQEDAYSRSGQHESTQYFDYRYDEAGRVLQKSEICSEHLSVNNSYEYSEYFTYDPRGLVTVKVTEANFPAQMDNSYRATASWRYNEKGDPVEMREETVGTNSDRSDSVEKKVWTYDSEGRLLQSTDTLTFHNDPGRNMTTTVTNTYDRRGRLVQTETERRFPEDSRRNSTATEQWEYNWEGKLAKEVSRLSYEEESMERYGGYTKTINYTYDLLGRQTGEEVVWEGPVENTRQEKTYTYGDDGMVDTATTEYTSQGKRSTNIAYYNENGLVAREENQLADPGAGHIVEYTFAYFYYPEGTQKPQQNMDKLDVILYGA